MAKLSNKIQRLAVTERGSYQVMSELHRKCNWPYVIRNVIAFGLQIPQVPEFGTSASSILCDRPFNLDCCRLCFTGDGAICMPEYISVTLPDRCWSPLRQRLCRFASCPKQHPRRAVIISLWSGICTDGKAGTRYLSLPRTLGPG